MLIEMKQSEVANIRCPEIFSRNTTLLQTQAMHLRKVTAKESFRKIVYGRITQIKCRKLLLYNIHLMFNLLLIPWYYLLIKIFFFAIHMSLVLVHLIFIKN